MRTLALAKLELSLGKLRQIPEPAVSRMVESLKAKGQLSPLVAGEREDGVLVLVDGFARHQAATRIGWTSMAIEVVRVSPVQMKAQLYVRNRERGLGLIEECRLVQELVDVDGLSQVEVGDALERHKSWVCRRLSLIRQVSPNLLADAQLGMLTAGSLRKLAQLQPRNQERLWAAARRSEISPPDLASLVQLWRRAPDPEARQFVLDHPAEAIRIARGKPEATTDARLGAPGEEVRTTLRIMRRAALRLVGRLRDGLGAVPAEGVPLLRDAHRQAEEDCARALADLADWLTTRERHHE